METLTIVVIVVSLLVLIPIGAWIIWSFIEIERIDARLRKREYERSRENWTNPKDYGYIIADKSSKSDYDFTHLPQEKE